MNQPSRPASVRDVFLLLSSIVTHAVAKRSAKDLALIPGTYLYWTLQLYAVFSVLAALALRRLPRWRVTRKRPVLSARREPQVPEPVPLAPLVTMYLPDVLEGNGSNVRWGPSPPASALRGADAPPRKNEPPGLRPVS